MTLSRRYLGASLVEAQESGLWLELNDALDFYEGIFGVSFSAQARMANVAVLQREGMTRQKLASLVDKVMVMPFFLKELKDGNRLIARFFLEARGQVYKALQQGGFHGQ